jgi:hypothetical protein
LRGFVDQEFASLDLGDKRRNDRLRRVLSSFLGSPQASIQAAGASWAEAMGAYRLLNKEATTLDAELAPHREATVQRVRAYQIVALIQDTTELDFTRKTRLEGRGTFGASDNPRRGFFLHPQFAVTEDRLPPGFTTLRSAHWTVRAVKDRILVPLDEEDRTKPIEVSAALFPQAAAGSFLSEAAFSAERAVQAREVTKERKEPITERSQTREANEGSASRCGSSR